MNIVVQALFLTQFCRYFCFPNVLPQAQLFKVLWVTEASLNLIFSSDGSLSFG